MMDAKRLHTIRDSCYHKEQGVENGMTTTLRGRGATINRSSDGVRLMCRTQKGMAASSGAGRGGGRVRPKLCRSLRLWLA